MERGMTARDFLGGIGSVALMLAMISLCLVFAVYDDLTERLGAVGPKPDDRHSRPALKQS
ncbi:MAG: hypothetical protein ACXWUN_02000 [Allosphingosinicella sp.]